MPFTGPGDASLPDHVKELSQEKRKQFVGAFNGRFADCEKDGGTTSECESSAFAVANAAIKELGGTPQEQGGTPPAEGQRGGQVDDPTGGGQPSGTTSVRDEDGDKGPDSQGRKFDSAEIETPRYWDFVDRQVQQEQANYNSIGGTDTKACANCQWLIAPTSCAVVSDYPDPILPTGLSDLWRERVRFEQKPLEVTIVGGGSSHEDEDKNYKQETKTEGGIEFKPSDFAVVPDTSEPSTWKLRLAADSSGNITVAQVARAITAMQPSGFRGQRVELTADQKSQAVSRIGTAIGKTGGTDDQKDNLRERLDKVKEGRTVDRLLGALKGLLPSLRSRPETASGFKVHKDVDGEYRWVAWVSNKWRDRDAPPEIFEQAAHEEFVRYLDAGGKYPEAWLWHTKGTKWGVADWADYFDGFLVMTGVVDKGMEHVAQSLAKEKDLGVSHGFRYRYSDKDRGIIGWYRSWEISPLPAKIAANQWTALGVIQQEVKQMDETKRQWLVGKLGEDTVKGIEAGTANARQELEKAGVDFKETAAGPEPLEEPEAKPKEGTVGSLDGATSKELVQAIGEAAVKAIEESENFKGVLTALKDVTTRLDQLEKTDDQKIAATLTAKSATKPAGHQASKDDATVLKDGESETLKEPALDEDWFGELTGTAAKVDG